MPAPDQAPQRAPQRPPALVERPGRVIGLPADHESATRVANAGALSERVDRLISDGLATLIRSRELRDIDPDGVLRKQKLKAVECPMLADQLVSGLGRHVPVVLAVDPGTNTVLFDKRAPQLLEKLPYAERRALLLSAVSVNPSSSVLAQSLSATRRLLGEDGEFIFEPIGADCCLIGIRPPTEIVSTEASDANPDLIEKIQTRFGHAVSYASFKQVDIKGSSTSLLTYDPRTTVFTVHPVLASLDEAQCLAVVDFALLNWKSASRVYSPSRCARMSRGLLDVARHYAVDVEDRAHLEAALVSLRERGCDVALLERFLAKVTDATGMRSVKRDVHFATRENAGESNSDYSSAGAAQYDAFKALQRRTYPEIKRLVANVEGAPPKDPSFLYPVTQVLGVADQLGGMELETIQKVANSQRSYRAFLTFGGSKAVNAFSSLLAIFPAHEILLFKKGDTLRVLENALEIPGIRAQKDNDRKAIETRRALNHLEWFKVMLGRELRIRKTSAPRIRMFGSFRSC
jgi:hypothetical protein